MAATRNTVIAAQQWDACEPLRHLSLVQVNLGLATCRTFQDSWRGVVESQVPQ